MEIINVKLFDTPVVYKNNERIYFPYKKSEALFYYLVVNKQATREELVNLFWGETEESTAKKNLRNAMYQIRKIFDMDIVISPQKSVVILNSKIKLESDLDSFLNNENIFLENNYGEFLKGFIVKNSEAFGWWISKKRQEYKDMYIYKLHNKIKYFLDKKEYDNAQKIAKILISEDEFDERAYRIIMDIYCKQGFFNKAIDTYNKLSEVLKNELEVTPDIKTKEIYDQIINMKSTKQEENKNNNEDLFFGREKELKFLKYNYNKFLTSKEGKSVLIIGEAGIGKSKLKDIFINNVNKKEIYLIDAICYQAEENYILKPWNSIFFTLSNIIKKEKINIPILWKELISHVFPVFNLEDKNININTIENIDSLKYQSIENAIISLFKNLAQRKKILLVFDDIQWMDKTSLSLLQSLIIDDKENNIIFIGNLRNSYEHKIDKFIALMAKFNKIEKIKLNRFNKKEVEEFSKLLLPEYEINNFLSEKIYKESEGNIFFLIEILNTLKNQGNINFMSSKIQDILKSRFIDISDDARKILNIASLFFEGFTINILKLIIGKDELDIMDIIEELENKFIIKEIISEDEIKFTFTHQKLREYIYMNQSAARRKILHNKIGLILEKSLKNDTSDRIMYSKLIYHFSNGGNKIKNLEYTIKNIKSYLDFTHELFPIENKEISINNLHINEEDIQKHFENIEQILNSIDYKHDSEIINLYILFFYMKGRYLIREGEYEKGIYCIQDVIRKSINIKNYNYILECYKQMIYYCIQTYNLDMIDKYINESLIIAKEKNIKHEVGILFRLKGLSCIMSCEYEKAQEFLNESINIFNSINKIYGNYSLNIAAAYNYIGEINRRKKNFLDSIKYYDKAISICENEKIIGGLSLFNTNAAQASFDMKEYKLAKKYLKKAIDLYKEIDSLWGRSICNGYMSIVSLIENNYKDSLYYLKEAQKYSKKLKSPYEQGIVCRVEAQIKIEISKNEKLHNMFSEYLPLTYEDYCDKGIELLKRINGCYEIEILKNLKTNL
ncbi:AAA family ATPase [Tepidibacter formicigenes]|jgi:pentatricopeptide repeat protein|uniref:Pentatricopeptide repeat domain-containing protein (PPR motif) n=1 Tax=Tepidibacter formicigenes DSM 15518 TaxID=1123349 RepID=A0A1M6N0C5_9FIRM|nr:AAA family ATPase [Tepidibacter formicigenes]SHJ89161.1 pentatricopeptide repeat domain-containing protein (PPR motif) [Tepidibacter formicigenes DSM 15518]